MKYFYLVAILCLFFIGSALAECNWNGYNFKKYSDEEYIFDDDGYKYSFIFCNVAKFSGECARREGNACLVDQMGNVRNLLSKWTDNSGPTFSETSEGLVLTFDNGDINLTTTIKCSETIELKARPPSMGRATYELSHPVACKKSGGDGGGGLSGGAIFLIVLLCVFVVYIIGFCFFNIKFRKMAFGEAFPHKAFWCALPGLFIAGIKFTFSCFGRKGGSASSYDQHESYGATDV